VDDQNILTTDTHINASGSHAAISRQGAFLFGFRL